MIFEVQSYKLLFEDAVYSISVGFLVGFINQFFLIFLNKNKISLFIKDILMSFIFTIFLYSYVISFANYNILRWYNVVFALIGFICFSPCYANITNTILSFIGVTFKVIFKNIKKNCIITIKSNPKKEISQKEQQKTLKNESIVLYNE